MGAEGLFNLEIIISAIDQFTGPLRSVTSSIAGVEAKFKGLNDTMKMMGKSKSEIDGINASLQRMADQKAFSNVANDLEKIGMAKGDIAAMEQSYMRMAQYQRDMAKAQADYAAGKDLAMSGVGSLATGAVGAFGIFELVKKAGEFQSNMAVIQDSTGATTKQMQGFGDAVMNASAQVSKFNDMQMAQIAQTLSSGGFGNIKDVQSLLLPTAKYAEVQMYEHKSSDPIEATKQAIEMAHVFGNYSPKKFESFLNDFNKYSMMQPGDSSQLAQTLTYLAPTANTMKMKQSDVMALAAIDNVIGLTGSHGGTNSADMILRLIPGMVGGMDGKAIMQKQTVQEWVGKGKNRHLKNVTKEVQVGTKYPKALQAMMDLGFSDSKGNSKFFNKDGSIKDLNGMLTTMINDAKKFNPKDLTEKYKDIFGVQGGRAAMLLSNPRSLEQLGKMRTQLGKTKNMDQINKDLQATPEGQLNLLKSNSMTMMLRIGQQLAISLNPAIAQVNKLLSKMLEFSQAHPQVAKLIGDFALLAVGGKMTEGVIKILAGNFKMAGAAIRMFKLKSAAGELTGFGKVAAGTWNVLKKGTGAFNDLVSKGVTKLGASLQKIGSAGVSAFKWLGGATLSGIKALGAGLKAFGSGALTVIKVVGQFGLALAKLGIQAARWAIQVAADWLIAMGPVGWIIMGVTAIIAAGIVMWKTNFLGFRDHLTSLWNDIKNIAVTAWNGLTSFFKQWGTTLLAIFVPVIGLPILLYQHWSQVVSIASNIWNNVKNTISNAVIEAVNTVESWFSSLGGFFSGLWSQAESWGANLVKSIANGISGAIGSISSAISNVVSSAKSAISGAASAVGSAVSSIIPHFASGGIVNGSTYALVGEAGPEAIIPLSDPSRGLALWMQAGQALGVLPSSSQSIGRRASLPSSGYSGGGPTIIVYASGNVTRNEQALGDIVSKAILNKVKMQGKI